MGKNKSGRRGGSAELGLGRDSFLKGWARKGLDEKLTSALGLKGVRGEARNSGRVSQAKQTSNAKTLKAGAHRFARGRAGPVCLSKACWGKRNRKCRGSEDILWALRKGRDPLWLDGRSEGWSKE